MHGRIFRAFPIGPFFIIPEGETATTGILAIGFSIQDKFDAQLASERQACILRDSRIGYLHHGTGGSVGALRLINATKC